MQETERDVLIRIETKLDIWREDFTKHIMEDNKRFDEVFSRLRSLDRFIGGLVALQIVSVLILKFWK